MYRARFCGEARTPHYPRGGRGHVHAHPRGADATHRPVPAVHPKPYGACEGRRSIRQFEDREISSEVLARILDAGLKAPSSNHQRQWGELVENILLAATAERLGSVVHIPVKKEPEQITAFLKVPNGYLLPALVMLGYASPDAETPTQVKATVENKVHWNKW